jgi:hypothetical protein
MAMRSISRRVCAACGTHIANTRVSLCRGVGARSILCCLTDVMDSMPSKRSCMRSMHAAHAFGDCGLCSMRCPIMCSLHVCSLHVCSLHDVQAEEALQAWYYCAAGEHLAPTTSAGGGVGAQAPAAPLAEPDCAAVPGQGADVSARAAARNATGADGQQTRPHRFKGVNVARRPSGATRYEVRCQLLGVERSYQGSYTTAEEAARVWCDFACNRMPPSCCNNHTCIAQ